MRLEHDTAAPDPLPDICSRPPPAGAAVAMPIVKARASSIVRGADRPAHRGDRGSLAQGALAGLIVALAMAVLIGWALDVDGLKSVLPGATTMKANTALGLAAGGLAVLLLGARSSAMRAIAVAAAFVLAMVGLLTVVQYLAGVSLGIDELLFLDPDTTSQPFNGRMSPGTAVGFVASGASLGLLILGRSHRAVLAGHALATIPAIIGLLSLLGYAYSVERLYHLGPFVAVALHTGIGLELLAAALLLERMDEGWARRFINRPIARATLVRMMLLSLIVPFTTGFLVVRGIRAGIYDAEFAPALFAAGATIALAWVALRAAAILGRAEGELRKTRAEADERARQLESSHHRHAALLEELPQLVWTCLPDGRCNYLSPQWLAYTGVPEAEQLGFGWQLVTHPADLARARAHWLGTVAGRHDYDIDTRLRRADGAYRWFKTRAKPIRDPDGDANYWFATCTDIQDIVEARDVLARSRTQLEAEVEARSLEMMALEAQLRQSQKMEAVGQLTGGLAHDFNNLLTGITGSLELLQKRIGQNRFDLVDRYVVTARDAARRATALTQRLLAFSRRQTLDPVATDINRLAAGMEELIRRTVGPAITLEVVGAAGLWATMVDQAQLEGALLNLCINGRDAMPGGGRLTVETANTWLDARTALERDLPEGEYVMLCVSDTGTGMTAEVQQRAFEPFFTTKPLGGGTGLGLSMVYGFVRQSGGQLRIHSEIGHGTTMRIYLPRHHGEPEDMRVAAPSGGVAAARNGETILVIDDEPTVRLLISEVLGEAGFTIIEASDGPAGLKAVQSGMRLDLVITDVGLPGGINGRQVADAARAVRPGLKVLFITGYAENAAVGPGQLEPGMTILTKPFAIDDLHRRLRDLL